MMSLGNWFGPATLLYLASATFGGIWWASTIANRVDVNGDRLTRLEGSTVTDARLTRLETEFGGLKQSNADLKQSVDRLLWRIERNRRGDEPN